MPIRYSRAWILLVLAVCLVGAFALRAQSPATMADQLSTDERVKKPGWWPTKGNAPRSDYVGSATCAGCHSDVARSQRQTDMSRTSMLPIQSDFLASQPKVTFKQGPYSYEISRSGQDELFSVTDAKQTISEPLVWAVGSGINGQSYLLEHQGKLYEARLSYYKAYKDFAITPNHPTVPDESLEKAIGRRISEDEAPKCYGCHTTASTTSDKFDPTHALPGITCEVCHGPGATHVAAHRSGMDDTGIGMELNPATLSPSDSVDFCGACHRTWWDVNLAGLSGIGTLRFPVYRLEKSRCWGKGDARVTCMACHDPHKALVTDTASYDGNCLSCHLSSVSAKPTADHPGPACKVATQNCASCHMPKYEVPDMHTKFTDHMIRVVRKDEVFPN